MYHTDFEALAALTATYNRRDPMTALLPVLLLAARFDGEAALRHASRLAALGPHPWGSPRVGVAADYVASQFRDAGLQEVRAQEFESHGVRGSNVIGVLRASGPEFLVIGAHHDTAPDAPGAYDDGGGVGVLIEAARAAAGRPRTRTLVFVSWDGEEASSTGKTTTPGSRAYVASLGGDARQLTAAVVIEMCGWKGGSPVFQPIPYADPLCAAGSVMTPAWLMRSAEASAREAGAAMGVGDPLIPWLYQAGVRTFRVRLYGDDISFLQAGLPALFVSDSSFSAYYPWYHQPSDTADKIDAASLERMGRAVLAVAEGLSRARVGPTQEPVWFAAFGRILGLGPLLALGLLSLAPGLVHASRSGGPALGARIAQALLFLALLWRHAVPALWVFLLPNLLTLPKRRWLSLLSLVPLLSLGTLGLLAWRRGMLSGLWLAPWELIVAALALALLFLGAPGRRPAPIPRKTLKRR